jgi:protein-tyrosine phosphatase
VIDIHCHLLYGLDDGPSTLEASAAMAKAAVQAGTTDIVATPHANDLFPFQPERISERLKELRAAAGDGLRIYTGCDFHLTPENLESALANPARFTINQKSYLLIELSETAIPPASGGIFDRLCAAGLTPVITHPERNHLLHAKVERLRDWVARGCLLQLTAGSFLGRFGPHARKSAETLTARGLAHFVASDAHDTDYRSPALDEVYAHLAGRYGEERARLLLVENPKAAIEGRPLDPAAFLPPRRHKWFFARWLSVLEY